MNGESGGILKKAIWPFKVSNIVEISLLDISK
jgi:hypothetical protein